MHSIKSCKTGEKYNLCRLISGGQTGVDRTALDTAIELGIPIGGWCPAGRRSADGTIPLKYPLIETTTRAYPARTRLNIRDSDATLIITHGRPRCGTRLTIELATKQLKPFLVIDTSNISQKAAVAMLSDWLKKTAPKVLNVAGPRASEAPALGRKVRALLRAVLASATAEKTAPWPPKRPITGSLLKSP